MNLTFYQYAIRFYDPKERDRFSLFANIAKKDLSFPKFENDFSKLSNYIEENSSYSTVISIFDELWQKYIYEGDL